MSLPGYVCRRLGTAVLAVVSCAGLYVPAAAVYPGTEWETVQPAAVGLDGDKLTTFVEKAGSSIRATGAIVRHGRMVAQWGEISDIISWVSAWKPQNSMCLFFLLEEGLLTSVHDSVGPYVPEAYPGKELIEKDRGMTFRHLANQVSGYSFTEKPGESFSYNDPATSTAASLLSAVVKRTYPDDDRIGYLRRKLAPLGLQDGLQSWMSVRDQCRLAWWWLNKGAWNGTQLVAQRFFDSYARPLVPHNLPHSTGEDPNGMYLASDGSRTGYDAQGIYGFWWWFNNRPCLDPTLRGGRIEHFFEGLPNDAYAAYGYGNNYVIVMPRLDMVAAFSPYSAAAHDWTLLVTAVTDADPTAPAVPGAPRTQVTSAGAVRLRWDAVEDADGSVDAYWVYRGGAFLAEVSDGATEFLDTATEDDTTYVYRLQAFNASGFADSLGPSAEVYVPSGQTSCRHAARGGDGLDTRMGRGAIEIAGTVLRPRAEAAIRTIRIVNCLGAVVRELRGPCMQPVELERLPAGVYGIMVQTAVGSERYRFVR